MQDERQRETIKRLRKLRKLRTQNGALEMPDEYKDYQEPISPRSKQLQRVLPDDVLPESDT